MTWSDAARAAAALARKRRVLNVHKNARERYRGRGRDLVELRMARGDRPGPTRTMRDSVAKSLRAMRANPNKFPLKMQKGYARMAAEWTAIRNARGYR